MRAFRAIAVFLLLLDVCLAVISLATFTVQSARCCGEDVGSSKAFFSLAVVHAVLLCLEVYPVVWLLQLTYAVLNPFLECTLILGLLLHTSLTEALVSLGIEAVTLVVKYRLQRTQDKEDDVDGLKSSYSWFAFGLAVLYWFVIAVLLVWATLAGGLCYYDGRLSLDFWKCVACEDGEPFDVTREACDDITKENFNFSVDNPWEQPEYSSICSDEDANACFFPWP